MSINTTDKGKKLFILQVVCLGLVWIATILRACAWWAGKRKYGQWSKNWREHVLMFVAVIFYNAMAAVALHGIIAGGIGKHASDITPDEQYIAFRAWFICELIYGPLAAIIRTSIALLLLRFRPGVCLELALYLCLFIVYGFTVPYFIVNLVQCSPTSYFWEQFRNSDMMGSCDHPRRLPDMAIAHSAIAASSDLFISGLSLYAIKNWRSSRPPQGKGLGIAALLLGWLEKIRKELSWDTPRVVLVSISRRAKKELSINRPKLMILALARLLNNAWKGDISVYWPKVTMMVLVGGLGGAAGVVMFLRIPYIETLAIKPDFLYRTVDVAMWSILEPCVGIVAGSLPYIWPLFVRPASKPRVVHIETSFEVRSESKSTDEYEAPLTTSTAKSTQQTRKPSKLTKVFHDSSIDAVPGTTRIRHILLSLGGIFAK